MEVFLSDTNDDSSSNGDALKLNNELKSWEKSYYFYSERVNVNERNKFIGSIYNTNDTKLVLRFEYIIIGTYDKGKNLWIWASESVTLDRSLIAQNNALKEFLRSDKNCKHLKKIIDASYTVIPTQDITNTLAIFATVIFESDRGQLMTLRGGEDRVHVIMINRILFEKV